MRLLCLVPGVLISIGLFPQSYAMPFVSDVPRVLAMAESVSVLRIGVLSVRKDTKELMLVVAICACAGFLLVTSNINRVFSSLGLLLAPMLDELVLPKKSEPS